MAEWYWPVPDSKTISSEFGLRPPPKQGASTNHRGIDISAPIDTNIVAASGGTVISSGPAQGYGNWIRISHGNGVVSIYGHMYSSGLLVSKGQVVQAGEVIAKVGSAGTSTGPHLHFQIEVDGVAQNPLNYISTDTIMEIPSGTIPDNAGDNSVGNILPSDAGDISTYTYSSTVPYNPESIVGQRIFNSTRQPIYAYADIYIGDKLITPKPNILQRFEIKRLTGAGDTASFSLFDDTWGELEKDFANNWDNVYLEYGYANDGVKSKRYYMKLDNYSISFNSTGVFMTVGAMSHGTVENLTQTTIPTYTKNPTDAVKAIASHMGWTVLNENIDSTESIDDMSDYFTVLNDFPVSYIKNNIVPFARTKDGEIMEFHLTDDNLVYFKAESFKIPKDDIRTYVYMKGYDSPIKDLNFNIKGIFGGTTNYEIATGERSSVFDPITKEEISSKEDTTSVITTATGETTHTNPNQSIPSIDSAGYSPTQMKNKLYYDVKRATTSHYEADMVIIGDPTIDLIEDIRIINVTDQGYLHHTSGIYKIESIVDSIENGYMLTTLHLIRNGTGEINDGVRILSPKVLVK